MVKKRYIIAGIILLYAAGKMYYVTKSVIFGNASSLKKKILILTSSGGGGNLEASKAMETYLKSDYDIQQCHAFKEILLPLDPFNILTLKQYSSEEVYNSFIPGKHFQLLGWIYHIGRWYIQSQKKQIIPLLRDYFIKTKPDLIASVIPVINNIVLEVAQELNIPFLLVPTDLDVTPYTLNIINPVYEKFHLGLIFNEPEIMAPIHEAQIANNHIHSLGAPLRPDFFTKKNKHVLRKRYEIDGNKPVVMILMGSHGADEIKNYVEHLLNITQPMHLVICIGKNEKSAAELAQLSFPSNISASIVGFTPHIADYMALSDLLITKSGTLSVCEALYMNLPLFLDATSTLLPWEKFNHEFVQKHGFGMSITSFDNIAPLVTNILEHKDELDLYKNNIQKLGKKDFGKELRELVRKILK